MGRRRESIRRKAEQIACMLWLNYGPTRTARMMGMSYEGLLRITKTQEFREIDAEVRRSVIGKMDATLARRTDGAQIREEVRDEMEDAVPEAFRVLLLNLREKHDLKAAPEILDRDPACQFAEGAHAGQQSTQIGVGVQCLRINAHEFVVKDAPKGSRVMLIFSRHPLLAESEDFLFWVGRQRSGGVQRCYGGDEAIMQQTNIRNRTARSCHPRFVVSS